MDYAMVDQSPLGSRFSLCPSTPTGLRDLVDGHWTRDGHRLMIMVCEDS
jgi:hypothetical protein